MTIAMGLVGLLTVFCACGVVLSERSLHSALWLVGTLFFVAVHFALLGADFVAALQVMIYAGAIMVLVVFTIMLLGIDKAVDSQGVGLPKYMAAIVCSLFAGVLAFAVSKEAVFGVAASANKPLDGSAKEVGKLLLTDHVFAMQVIALLLLAAIIGAVVLAYNKPRPLAAGRGLRAMHPEKNNA